MIAPATEVRRMAEQARAAGYGATPETAFQRYQDVVNLIGNDEPSLLLADVLRWQGTVMRDRGRASEAEPLYRRSLQVASDIGYESGVAHALNCLAGLAQRRGNIVSAANILTDAHIMAEKCGERQLIVMIQSNLGIIADIRGNPVAALAHFRVALRTAEAIGDEQQVVRVLINLGCFLVKQQRHDEAESALTRGLSIAKTRGDLYYEGVIEENLAELHLTLGEIDEAHPSIRRALDIAEQRRDDVHKASALKLRGAYERLSGRSREAVDTLRYGLTLAAVGEDALLGGEILYQFGLALYEANDAPMAREVWRTALEAFERIAAREWLARVNERLEYGSTRRYL